MSNNAGDPSAVGLDPVWIAASLVHRGAAPTSVEFKEFIGTGQMSRNARFSVTWPQNQGPNSIVVKVPSADLPTRDISFSLNLYRNECEFYRSLVSLVGITVPNTYAVHYDGEGGDFAIILEDMSGSEQGDHFSAPSRALLELAIAQAVALHAPLWGNTQIPECDFMRDDVDERTASVQADLSASLPAVFERLSSGLDPEVADLLRRFASVGKQWSRLIGVPTTLVHGDFRADNFMLGVDASAPSMATVDWQTLRLGLGVTDIAYLIGGSLEPIARREIEGELVDSYLAQLHQIGVSYSAEQCRNDYALAALHGVLIAITATEFANQTERGDALFTLMLNRHGRHALDLGSLDAVVANTRNEN